MATKPQKPAKTFGFEVEDDVEAVIQIGDSKQVGRPGCGRHCRVSPALNQDDRREHDLDRADEQVERRGRAARNHVEHHEPINQEDYSDKEDSDGPHV